MKFVCRCLRMCPRTIGLGFMDNKDASRTIRTRFMDRFMVTPRHTREFTERRFLMYESLYKGRLAWLLLIHILYFNEDTSMIGTLQHRYMLYTENIFCWHIYPKNFSDYFFFKIGSLVNFSVKCHQRKGPRGEVVRRWRGCPHIP